MFVCHWVERLWQLLDWLNLFDFLAIDIFSLCLLVSTNLLLVFYFVRCDWLECTVQRFLLVARPDIFNLIGCVQVVWHLIG